MNPLAAGAVLVLLATGDPSTSAGGAPKLCMVKLERVAPAQGVGCQQSGQQFAPTPVPWLHHPTGPTGRKIWL